MLFRLSASHVSKSVRDWVCASEYLPKSRILFITMYVAISPYWLNTDLFLSGCGLYFSDDGRAGVRARRWERGEGTGFISALLGYLCSLLLGESCQIFPPEALQLPGRVHGLLFQQLVSTCVLYSPNLLLFRGLRITIILYSDTLLYI